MTVESICERGGPRRPSREKCSQPLSFLTAGERCRSRVRSLLQPCIFRTRVIDVIQSRKKKSGKVDLLQESREQVLPP